MKVLVLARRVDGLDNTPSAWGPGWAPCWVGEGPGPWIVHQALEKCRECMQRFDPEAYQFTVVIAEYDVW